MSNMTSPFETKTCGRCGGTGQYSYCTAHGHTCFKCGGTGTQYTKRGLLAFQRFEAACSKPAGELVVGDVYFDSVRGGRWHVVTAVVPVGTTEVRICAERQDYTTQLGTPMRVRQTKEARAAKLAEALAYQATLPKR